MENPGKLKSKITNKENLVIVTPQRKSTVLIIIFSLFSIQSSYGLIDNIVIIKESPQVFAVMFILFGTIFFFSFKELLWQIKGKTIITVNKEFLTIRKKGSYWFKKKVYNSKEIKNITADSYPVSLGPLAMLQLLRIAHPTKVTFSYGFSTIKLVSEIDLAESNHIIDLIQQKINNV